MTEPGADGAGGERDGVRERYLAAAAQVAALEAELARLRPLAEQLEGELERAEARIADLDRERQRLTGEAMRAQQEAADASAQLRSVLESASWRVTKPIRRLRGSTRPEA